MGFIFVRHRLESCPYLPLPGVGMSYRDVRLSSDAGVEVFYFTCLQYGHYLWQEGHAGRALLALTRALYADLPDGTAVLDQWPLPYQAIHWVVATHPSQDFPGNPRISFQHQATRIEGPNWELRRARAWAVWHLICHAKPELPADPKQAITEPSHQMIEAALSHWGQHGEAKLWQSIF